MSTAKRILIVEDEELIAKTLEIRLTKEGFSVRVATDGQAGLRATKQYVPHLILLDLLLPKMDGVSMLKELRKKESAHEVPVIILTNISDTALLMEALEQGKLYYKKNKKTVLNSVAERGMKKYFNTRLNQGIDDFLIKSNSDLDEIVAKIKSRLQVS